MPLGGLQHYTIEPADLERTKDFYCDVLGLENGDRPPLDFPGYWLYSGGVATVHLMGTRKPREESSFAVPRRNTKTPAASITLRLPRPTSTACASVSSRKTSSSAKASCRERAIRSSSSTTRTALAWN